MRLLVFGGRFFDKWSYIYDCLDKAIEGEAIFCIIEGGADGADSIARQWARIRQVPCITHHADWKRHGKSAGPRRNIAMIQLWNPTHAVGFPGRKGTAHMRELLLKRPDISFWDLTE